MVLKLSYYRTFPALFFLSFFPTSIFSLHGLCNSIRLSARYTHMYTYATACNNTDKFCDDYNLEFSEQPPSNFQHLILASGYYMISMTTIACSLQTQSHLEF